MFSYIVIVHYPVTNSNGTRLKLYYDLNSCKNVIFKILWYLKRVNSKRMWLSKLFTVITLTS